MREGNMPRQRASAVICFSESFAGILQKAGLPTVSHLDRPAGEYAPAIYVHQPEIVLGLPTVVDWPKELMYLWPQQFANRLEDFSDRLRAKGFPPLPPQFPPQWSNFRRAIDAGLAIAVCFAEKVHVDDRHQVYEELFRQEAERLEEKNKIARFEKMPHSEDAQDDILRLQEQLLSENAENPDELSVDDAVMCVGHLESVVQYTAHAFWEVAPVAVHGRWGNEHFMAAHGFRLKNQEPPDSKIVLSCHAPLWARDMVPFFGPKIQVALDMTFVESPDRIEPLFENVVGDVLGCAVRSERGTVLVLPECKDQTAKVELIRLLATKLWEPLQELCEPRPKAAPVSVQASQSQPPQAAGQSAEGDAQVGVFPWGRASLAIALLIVLEFFAVMGAWLWGDGQNPLQKIGNCWWLLVSVFTAVTFVSPFILGRKGWSQVKKTWHSWSGEV
jgi:hypothetical protein